MLDVVAAFRLLITTRPSGQPPRPRQLADLTDAWQSGPVGDRPDWTRLRAFLDHLDRCQQSPSQSAMGDPGNYPHAEDARRNTPPQLREHGLTASADSLWRTRSTADA